MALTWSEIRARAGAFARDWRMGQHERAEAQTFWNEFFQVFGVHRKRVASFEVPVRLRARGGFIDLFWKGVLVVEHKSAGANLASAAEQAHDYFAGIPDEDLPRFVLVSDFQRFSLRDLDSGERWEFPLAELPKNVRRFAFILGQTTRTTKEPEPANKRAADLMASLHDALAEDGFVGHDLELFLVRLLFCFFADDTGIFEPRDHLHSLLSATRDNGSDVGPLLAEVFEILDTAVPARQKSLDADMARLPYVNGGLFRDRTRTPSFTKELRVLLLKCSAYDWSLVDPVIFGALFQSVGHVQERRRDQGMHYTSEANILKVIGPLLRAPAHPDHRFRCMPITDSGRSRSPIPEHADR